MTHEYDALVIGGGQSGLAGAHHLTARGFRTAVLEAGPEATGSWPRYYDSLTLFSPAAYSGLPGRRFPGDLDRYPHRDEVVDYLRGYAAGLDAEIHTGTPVQTVATGEAGFTVTTGTGAVFTAPRVIAATGSFGSPVMPVLPGQDEFGGKVLHSSDYRSPDEYADRRVIVVGAGNSAVQIAAELAHHTDDVVLASRAPVKFVAQRLLGRDVHFWFTVTGFDAAPLARFVADPPTQPVLDHGRYRAAVAAGKPQRRAMFTGFDAEGVVWPDGSRTSVDVVVFATGYRPHLRYLAGTGALTDTGAPRHRRGISSTHPGLGYLGLEWQRTPSSASLRGVGRDAAWLAQRLVPAAVAPRPVDRTR
ncbi:NAD(P)/FAD-dependent oxidoreductase [Nocardia zapadnayensis]|uniref:flavin-containing monooxygenase n=1 Tax=Nocardia rhamnosiphila TaxID=426716 RepID=UPI0022487048|nr:NAD(P)/FAD-dependent oxidoreductase [Nocardia zapadnayensis]MCX0275083.1 NAD(P)/FAD-dependent oxidoreductase [Nocardia zapadnayensis]